MVVPTRDIDDALSTMYGEEAVSVILTLKVDTKEAAQIAAEVAQFDPVADVFLVTGDTDIVLKAKFASYDILKEFVMKTIMPIHGVKDAKTLMVVTTYKEDGDVKEVG